MKPKVMFVCLGNICRSPAANGIFEQMVAQRGLQDKIVVDSAGTYPGHRGELPDPRMRRAALERGYNLTHRARTVSEDDFYDFDEKAYCLTGRRYHKKYSLGDPVRIKVVRANLERKQLDFALVE